MAVFLKRPWDGSTCVKITRLILENFNLLFSLTETVRVISRDPPFKGTVKEKLKGV